MGNLGRGLVVVVLLLARLCAGEALKAPIPEESPALTLDEAVVIALAKNPEIWRAIEEIRRMRGVLVEVRAQALPQLNMVGTYTQQDLRLLRGGGAFSGGNIPGTSGATVPGTSTAPRSEPVASAVTSPAAFASPQTATTSPAAFASPQITAAAPSQATFATQEIAAAAPAEVTLATPQIAAASPEALPAALQSGTDAATSGTTIVIVTGTQPRAVLQNKSWTVALQATQLLYSGGQTKAALKIARFSEDSSYYALRDTIDRVVATVRTQFYEVLRNRALIRVQEESLRLLEEAAREQRLRFEAGTVARINVLRAEVEAANVRPELIAARNNYTVSQWRLAKSVGFTRDPKRPGVVPFRVMGELPAESRSVSLGQAFAMAYQRRASLKVQRQNILIQKQQVKLELAGYKPILQANGGYEFRNSRLSEDLGDVVNGWFFGFTGNWAIFDGLATAGRVKQARAELERARINYEEGLQQVDLEIQESYSRLQQAREVLASQLKNIEQAQETVRLAAERLATGVGTQLELLDARVALTRAQVTELSARFVLNSALAEFDRVTGAGTLYEEKFLDPVMRRAVKRGLPEGLP